MRTGDFYFRGDDRRCTTERSRLASGGVKLPGEQLELGMSLIEKMSSADFEPERYADEHRERALAMIEKKVEG
jgi:non-homologous end joining protein Ku